MKKAKNSLTIVLMTSSIVLMLVLEIFWLHSAYRDELAQLKRETNFIFRTTLFAMQDTLIEKSIKPLGKDTSDIAPKTLVKGARYFFDAKVKHEGSHELLSDNIQIFINSPGDSIDPRLHRPLIKELRKSGNSQRRFTIRLGNDSLDRKKVENNYRIALAEAKINIDFKIKNSKPGEEFSGYATKFDTDWVPIIPSAHYVASFNNVHFIIFRKITPQILFSIFLSSLTILSFIFMFRSIRSQQRLMELKNDFISNITHELKTPIATVSVALEALKNFNGIENPVRTKEYLDIAQHELNRLSILSDKVLNTSLFDEKGITLDFEKVDLEQTIVSILNSMKLVMEKSHATVSFDKTGSDFLVQGSAVHLTNVIHNLLDNALKYSPSQPDISVNLKDLGDTISLSIGDKGPGIPAEFQKKIFEKFFRMPTGNVHTIKGYGLGLSYVDGVVKAHRGKIDVKSEVEKGSVFTITIPKNFNPKTNF